MNDNTQNVLIVDDKVENLVSLEAVLSSLDVNILKAQSGRDALSILMKHDIDVVLLDVQMPEMDGFEVCQLMKGQKRTANIPIIFITAIISDEQNILSGYVSGAIDYIVKPFNPKILVNKLKTLLQLESSRKQLSLAMSDMEMQKKYFESILSAAGDGVMGVDSEGKIIFANPAALSILRYKRDELVGHSVMTLWSPEGANALSYDVSPFYQAMKESKTLSIDETFFYQSTHVAVPVSILCSPLASSEVGSVIVFQDISERKALEGKLVAQAKTDSLTGLANRVMFVQTLRQALARAKRLNKSLAVLFLDLDQFKHINDTLGHDAGDVLLTNVAARIIHCVRKNDTVARLGGDEFTILLEDVRHDEDAARVSEKILLSLKDPFSLGGSEIVISASIGIALYPSCGDSAADLMQAADVAMYRVKAFGRNAYQYFTPEMNADAQERLAMEQELRQAFNNNSLDLHYQPQISVIDDNIVGFEALLRWNRPGHGFVQPSDFICILEETGLILPFGKWILWMSCLQAKNWVNMGVLKPGSRMCVNISARQFSSADFYDSLLSTLEQTELAPEYLELEITESMLLTDSRAAQSLIKKIKSNQINISIDDFGTGYSSLSYLKEYPIDVIKIDRSFILNIIDSPRDQSLLQSIIDMCHALGFCVLVEGVEDEESLKVLEKMGIDRYQGFYFTKALPAEEMVAFLSEKNKITL